MPEAKIVSLKFRKRLIAQDERVAAVYFPLTCMFSLLVTTNGKPQMEMATIGKEGIVGASEVIPGAGRNGPEPRPDTGHGGADRRRCLPESDRPSAAACIRLIHEHLYALMRQILFGAACNRVHSMEERCARWLLMTHDRAGEDTFPLTQEFLSHMLGVRRATVNVATGMLKKAGFIRYVRGKITVIDRPGLESASCECYQAILKVYAHLVPEAPKPGR